MKFPLWQHYTFSRAMQKLFFYPLCLHCSNAAVIENILCVPCAKELCRSLRRNGSDALLHHNKLSSMLWGSVRREQNSRSMKLLWHLLQKHSSLPELCKANGITHMVLAPSSKQRWEMSGLELLARRMAENLSLEFLSAILMKTEDRKQHKLRAKARLDTPLFMKVSPGKESLLQGKRILLFDDVCTTSTSIFQAEVLLRKTGAAFVLPYTLLKKDFVPLNS